MEICRMCKYELSTPRLSKVIVWQTYIHTDRQTWPKLYTTPFRGWSKIYIMPHTWRTQADTSWMLWDSDCCRPAASHELTTHFHLPRLQAQHRIILLHARLDYELHSSSNLMRVYSDAYSTTVHSTYSLLLVLLLTLVRGTIWKIYGTLCRPTVDIHIYYITVLRWAK